VFNDDRSAVHSHIRFRRRKPRSVTEFLHRQMSKTRLRRSIDFAVRRATVQCQRISNEGGDRSLLPGLNTSLEDTIAASDRGALVRRLRQCRAASSADISASRKIHCRRITEAETNPAMPLPVIKRLCQLVFSFGH